MSDHLLVVPLLLATFASPPVLAQPSGPPGGPEAGAGTQPARADVAPTTKPGDDLPGVSMDRAAGHVDVAAVLIRRKADWLELLATTPGMREHEALLTLEAKPSHAHFALLMLGLEPGRPRDIERRGDEYVAKPPQGPPVRIALIYEENGERREVPANRWIMNRKTNQPLENNRWLFTGSRIVRSQKGERFYLADRSGSVISLVNFGDDVLVRDTTATNRTDNEQWGARTKALPPVGTAVTIRLKPVEVADGDDAADSEPATRERPAATQPAR